MKSFQNSEHPQDYDREERKVSESPSGLRRTSSTPSALSSSQEHDVTVAFPERRPSHDKDSARTIHCKEFELAAKTSQAVTPTEGQQFEFDEEVLSFSQSGEGLGGVAGLGEARQSELSRKLCQEDSQTASQAEKSVTASSSGGGLVNRLDASSSFSSSTLKGRLEGSQGLSSSMEVKKPALQRRMSADQTGTTKRRPEGLHLSSSHSRPVNHPPVVTEGNYDDHVPCPAALADISFQTP